MCTNRLFSEGGMIGLLEQAAELFREVLTYCNHIHTYIHTNVRMTILYICI